MQNAGMRVQSRMYLQWALVPLGAGGCSTPRRRRPPAHALPLAPAAPSPLNTDLRRCARRGPALPGSPRRSSGGGGAVPAAGRPRAAAAWWRAAAGTNTSPQSRPPPALVERRLWGGSRWGGLGKLGRMLRPITQPAASPLLAPLPPPSPCPTSSSGLYAFQSAFLICRGCRGVEGGRDVGSGRKCAAGVHAWRQGGRQAQGQQPRTACWQQAPRAGSTPLAVLRQRLVVQAAPPPPPCL